MNVADEDRLLRSTARRGLWWALALVSSYMLVETIGGLITNSLLLLADAGHMLTDAASLGLALLAIWLAARPPSTRWSFGLLRAEVLIALVNVVSLWFVAGWIFLEAYRRFQAPPEVMGSLMLGIGAGGLLVNLAGAWILRPSARDSLNVKAAFLHVLGDLLGSVAVVVGGVLIIAFDWRVLDPILAGFIGLLIVAGSGRVLWKIGHMLLEGTPSPALLGGLCQRFERVQGVTGVHDIHVWSLTSRYNVLSAHVTTDLPLPDRRELLLQRLRDIASKEFGLAHVTLQLEDSQEGCDEKHHFAHESPSKGPVSS